MSFLRFHLTAPKFGELRIALNDREDSVPTINVDGGEAPPCSPALPLIEAAPGSRLLGFMPTGSMPVQTASSTRGRKPRSLPAISLGVGLVRRYEAEKMYGVRRENGALKLKSLRRRHYEIIARHLSGQSNEMIHLEMGLSISSISRILNDPLAAAILKRSYKDRQSELDALAGHAVGAVRHALTVGSTSEKLAAVDKYAKLKSVIAPESNPMESAEDFARAIVQNAQNVQVNIGVR